MEALLPYYERELVMLRRHCREFAERFPKIAGKLQMAGEVCEDPHVEQLIESVALLAARVSKRLDDDYPQFTEALFETLLPHYLRPFPSCSIIQVGSAQADGAAPALIIPRGTTMDSASVQGVRCRFKTVYDIALAPLTLSAARFDALIKAPVGLSLPAGAGASISVAIDDASDQAGATSPAALRVFIDGEPSFCAALRDALFLRAVCAHVEADDGRWIALPALPLHPVGFAEQEALIPFGARSHPAYRILTEYFAFPEKFNFFDIDLAALRARLPADCRRFTLHLALAGLRADSHNARLLRSLSSANLLLGCSPVVNLFDRHGVPIAVTHLSADYGVVADTANARGYEVYSIDSVQMVRQRGNGDLITEFRPFYSLRHGEGDAKKGHYWMLRHDDALAAASPGQEKRLTLIDADFNPVQVEHASLSIELTCTNRHFPALLKYGQAGGDLTSLEVSGDCPIRLLRKPTQPHRFDPGFGLHWRLISHLSVNHHSLAQEGLTALREMLALYDLPQSPTSQRQIAGIVGLAHADTATWMRHRRGASLVHGIEVCMTLDEEAFVGSGMHLFVQVIDQFLGLYAQLNSFVELRVLSKQSGEELIRCKPRSGNVNLA
jgi:type VI secretion system protein ImpG